MTSKLLVKPQEPSAEGVVLNITPESAGWTHVGFRVLRLRDGQGAAACEPGRETCLVILSGKADVTAGDHVWTGIGGRTSVFEDAAPYAVYVPAGVSYRVTGAGESEAEIAVCTAPGGSKREPRLIEPLSLKIEVRGQGTNTRYVRDILPETQPADSLLVVEVLTPAGHWSSYPPHKHDEDVPGVETPLEETYYHRISRPEGFAFQRVYTADRGLDETLTVHDGDAVTVPRGYHPCAAAHGYDLYYLNVMAGPKRRWLFTNDPDHDWLLQR